MLYFKDILFLISTFWIIHLFTKKKKNNNKFIKYNLLKTNMQSGVDQGKIWGIFRAPS